MQNLTPPENNQDAFNRVWKHFIVEGNPQCTNLQKKCLYRHENNGCAIGCMLPDDLAQLADTTLSGNAINYVIKSIPGVKKWLENVHNDLLVQLQHAHDNPCYSLSAMKMELLKIARRFDLTIPE